MIEHHRPDLAIVPENVFYRNQERLAARPPSTLRDKRRPTYALSGLIKCGVCGASYVQVSTTMGCSAHRLKACSNNRRVRREDLEQAVFDGLTQRLGQPEVMSWFVPHYQQEREPAAESAAHLKARALQRLSELEAEIGSIREQLRLQPGPHARRILNEDLETLGEERERFKREAAKVDSPPVTELTTSYVLERFKALLKDLGGALIGDERDAARARDIVRTLITTVTVTPFDGYGGRPDGKGGQGIRVVIEGEISRLVERATLEKKIMHKRGAEDVHDLPIAMFWFYVDLFQPRTTEEQQVWRDAGVIGRMLDDADRPLLFSEMIAAMSDRNREPTAEEAEADETRARIGLAQYRRGKWAKAIRIAGTHGWVWSDRDVTDAEWRTRFDQSVDGRVPNVHDQDGAGVSCSAPVGVIRMGAPEGAVIKIECR